jgi:hypothetical protein
MLSDRSGRLPVILLSNDAHRAGAIVSGRAVVSGRAYFVGGYSCCMKVTRRAEISGGNQLTQERVAT